MSDDNFPTTEHKTRFAIAMLASFSQQYSNANPGAQGTPALSTLNDITTRLAALKPTAERFTAKTTVLIENVRHHMEEEEQDWFPKVREGLGRKALQDLGAELLEAKKKAPRKPSQPSALKKTIDAIIA